MDSIQHCTSGKDTIFWLDVRCVPGDPPTMTLPEPLRSQEIPAPTDQLVTLETAILSLVASRGLDKTICPSEAARAIGGDHPDGWGPLMQPIRRVAVRLAKEGRLIITRKGRTVDPDDFRGVYRLGLPRLD